MSPPAYRAATNWRWRVTVAEAGRKRGTVARSLYPSEHVTLVARLLAERPDLIDVVEDLAADLLGDTDRRDVADEVVDSYLDVEFTEIGARVGRVPGGYVDEHEARWQMLEELLEPCLEDIARRWRLGFEEAAVELAVGALHGLYDLREAPEYTLIRWGATADDTFALAQNVTFACERLGCELPSEEVVERTTEWERWR